MSLLQWQAQYSIGVESVDHEHRQMIDLINALCDEMDEHSDAERIELLLGEIYASIAAHFALEERVMRNANYPQYEDHKLDHENLLDELVAIMDHFVTNPVDGASQLAEKLGDWFTIHFSSFDARLHGALDHNPKD